MVPSHRKFRWGCEWRLSMTFMCGINIFPFSSELKCSPRIFERDMAREVNLLQDVTIFVAKRVVKCTSDILNRTRVCAIPPVNFFPTRLKSSRGRNNARPVVLIIRPSLQATISKAQLTRWQIGSPHVGEKTDARASSSCLEERASLWTTVVCTFVFRLPHDASAFVLR